jgi:hypothetical protein
VASIEVTIPSNRRSSGETAPVSVSKATKFSRE